jgi:hypothetical protein
MGISSPFRVKTGKVQSEQMFSGSPPQADLRSASLEVSEGPGADSCAARKKDDAPFRLRASLM